MPSFPDRARAALLGLALGDGYGRPLEFVRGPSVRTLPVDVTRLRWTDDTHMALYLAEVVAGRVPGPLDDDAFGHAVGRAFVTWSHDPLTPSTAPGNTCLAGARAYEQHGDWRRSGVRGSDGCGAVMRIAPLPMAFAHDELVRAARIQATVTHDAPNARDAAVAASVLLRRLLDGAPLDAATVSGVVASVAWESPTTAEALATAVAWAARREGEWLDEAGMPPGDGGWRSPSALGLAVAAALRWGDDVATAIDRAARIDGDSDSVACLAGMLLGGAGRPLPEAWLPGLFRRGEIEAAARFSVGVSSRPEPPAC